LIEIFGADRLAWGSNVPAYEGSLTESLKLAQDALT